MARVRAGRKPALALALVMLVPHPARADHSTTTDDAGVVVTHRTAARVWLARPSASGPVPPEALEEVWGASPGTTVGSVAWNGTNHLVAWDSIPNPYRWRYYNIGAALVPGEGPVRRIISYPPIGSAPRVASDGDRFLVVWQREETTYEPETGTEVRTPQLLGELLSGSGYDVRRSIPVLDSAVRPAVASDGGSYLVVAATYTRAMVYGACYVSYLLCLTGSVPVSLVAVRVLADGTVLNPVPIPASALVGTPAVAGGDEGFLVAWTFRGAILAMRFSALGVPLDAVPAAVAPGSGTPDVTWTGSRYAIAWEEDGGITGVHVEPSGLTADPFRIDDARGAWSRPALAASGDRTAVAFYRDQRLWVQVLGV